jgi:predicted CoA-binding protein
MVINGNADPYQVLKNAKSILLVDWPDPGVPRTLINAGFTVYSFSPDAYSEAKLVADLPAGKKGFPPSKDESGYLVFEKLEGRPSSVDLVNIFRPEAEHAKIIENYVLPLKAKVIWLHPPVISASTAATAAEKGLLFIEGINIAEIASKI